MKKILIVGAILLIVFLIYLSNIDKKVYYLTLGDSLAYGEDYNGRKTKGYTGYVKDYLQNKNLLETYLNGFAAKGERINDLKTKINNNVSVTHQNKQITIQNALIKADLITISIGANDILVKVNQNQKINYDKLYEYVDHSATELDELLKLIKEYCKEDILLIGYYNPYPDEELTRVFEYLNKKYKEVSENNNITFVETTPIFKNHSEYLPDPQNIHPSLEGYHAISNKIIKSLSKTLLNS